MAKVSILIEVSDEINDLVVKPHKRNSSFSKLMSTLLEGYAKDPHVRAYAEGTLDNMRKASVEELDNALNSMTSSLSNLGVYTGELSSSTEGGLRHFQNYSDNKIVEETNVNKETEEIKESVVQLKEQNAMIMEMLSQLMSGGFNQIDKQTEINNIPQSTVSAETNNEVSKPNLRVVKDDFKEESVNKEEVIIKENEDENDEDMVNASDIFSGFLSGNVYSM